MLRCLFDKFCNTLVLILQVFYLLLLMPYNHENNTLVILVLFILFIRTFKSTDIKGLVLLVITVISILVFIKDDAISPILPYM